jgi:hypothetical protein
MALSPSGGKTRSRESSYSIGQEGGHPEGWLHPLRSLTGKHTWQIIKK